MTSPVRVTLAGWRWSRRAGWRVVPIPVVRDGRELRRYRVTRHGIFAGEYKTPEELAKVVDLATLVEDSADASVTDRE